MDRHRDQPTEGPIYPLVADKNVIQFCLSNEQEKVDTCQAYSFTNRPKEKFIHSIVQYSRTIVILKQTWYTEVCFERNLYLYMSAQQEQLFYFCRTQIITDLIIMDSYPLLIPPPWSRQGVVTVGRVNRDLWI